MSNHHTSVYVTETWAMEANTADGFVWLSLSEKGLYHGRVSLHFTPKGQKVFEVVTKLTEQFNEAMKLIAAEEQTPSATFMINDEYIDPSNYEG